MQLTPDSNSRHVISEMIDLTLARQRHTAPTPLLCHDLHIEERKDHVGSPKALDSTPMTTPLVHALLNGCASSSIITFAAGVCMIKPPLELRD